MSRNLREKWIVFFALPQADIDAQLARLARDDDGLELFLTDPRNSTPNTAFESLNDFARLHFTLIMAAVPVVPSPRVPELDDHLAHTAAAELAADAVTLAREKRASPLSKSEASRIFDTVLPVILRRYRLDELAATFETDRRAYDMRAEIGRRFNGVWPFDIEDHDAHRRQLAARFGPGGLREIEERVAVIEAMQESDCDP